MLAVATRADDKIAHYTHMTHPLLEQHATKWGADFIILNGEPPVMSDDGHPHFRIMECYNLLETYDRVLVMDSDMLITKHCPNPFEEVPATKIGTVLEDKGSRKAARNARMRDIQNTWGDVGWREEYLNSGFLLVSRMHRDIFQPYNGQYWTQDGSDDVHLGFQIHRLGFKIYPLSFKFNHMSMFSEPWNNGGASRFDSYIIHYAGGQGDKLNKIMGDIQHHEYFDTV